MSENMNFHRRTWPAGAALCFDRNYSNKAWWSLCEIVDVDPDRRVILARYPLAPGDWEFWCHPDNGYQPLTALARALLRVARD